MFAWSKIFWKTTFSIIFFNIRLGNWFILGKILSVVIIMEDKYFFRKFVINKVDYYQLLITVWYWTLITDVWSCQGIISCNHHTSNLSSLQLLNCTFRLRFQLVLKHLETIEIEIFLDIIPSWWWHLFLCNVFTSHS